MSDVNYIKKSPQIVLQGTANGSALVETSGYIGFILATIGSTGSCRTSVWVNVGTARATSPTAAPNLILAGSHMAQGSSTPALSSFSMLMDQVLITHSDITGTYTSTAALRD